MKRRKKTKRAIVIRRKVSRAKRNPYKSHIIVAKDYQGHSWYYDGESRFGRSKEYAEKYSGKEYAYAVAKRLVKRLPKKILSLHVAHV